ncbi:DASH family cryptochrome [Alkalimonas collagenimarina]|uniref:Cryptochrome DASH n=1 Tax=Alkalimonas collagenimarina TaxID=400390 RepID=A0ABT9H1F0_9GAMM|nr:DASH family cryptochrome [Alkalimonas collagenimarina]MDP4537149.1 DASH family cryptochrome [Alkalimonas collagenimarina]
MHKVGLFWFQQDLRLSDNSALLTACQQCTQLIMVYCAEPGWFSPGHYNSKRMGSQRWRFVLDSVQELQQQLKQGGQQLLIRFQSPVQAISELISHYEVDAIYRSRQPGFYEQQQWQQIQSRFPYLHYSEIDSNTLFEQQQLPFPLHELPASFSQFRKLAERLKVLPAQQAPTHIPVSPVKDALCADLPAYPHWLQPIMYGGEASGQQHLQQYFKGSLASHYKEVRNELDGFTNSTKFSAWLASGCISPRQVISALNDYETQHGQNDSTYWIYFELLWREYFHWYSHCFGKQLFLRHGIKTQHSLHTSFYPQRFRAWCAGNTPYPLVNACMHQLNDTGYLSNRGRQIVASCFVNELQLDWRYGAAWFEQQLIDYDVAVNWGNWQYLAGVGVDPRGQRHFDIAKQQSRYDADGSFIKRWNGGKAHSALDWVDAADWPCS